MLACFEITQRLPKHARQSQVAEGSKKQLHNRTTCTTKPETQWFCESITQTFIEHKRAKQSADVFLMSVGW